MGKCAAISVSETTDDKRILIGGKDETFQSAIKRDKLLARKTRQLEDAAKKMFPELPFVTDYSWCGTFAETEDGLPCIGPVKSIQILILPADSVETEFCSAFWQQRLLQT